MRHWVILFMHFLANLARVLGPGGARSVVAESLLVEHRPKFHLSRCFG